MNIEGIKMIGSPCNHKLFLLLHSLSGNFVYLCRQNVIKCFSGYAYRSCLKRFSIKFNTVERENVADFALEYLYEIGTAARFETNK